MIALLWIPFAWASLAAILYAASWLEHLAIAPDLAVAAPAARRLGPSSVAGQVARDPSRWLARTA